MIGNRRPFPPLGLLVFVVGATSLGAEIAAARLMAPFFGASTIVWANTIGVVLVSLSVGYWLRRRPPPRPPPPPGRRAGARPPARRPELRGLCLVVLASAALFAVIPFAARPFLHASVEALDTISA